MWMDDGQTTDADGRWVITIAHCEHFVLRQAKKRKKYEKMEILPFSALNLY